MLTLITYYFNVIQNSLIMKNINQYLFDKKSISQEQFNYLELIREKKILSLYYELRIILYLGILLFTGAVGYLAYQNLGVLGHIASMVILFLSILIGFKFIIKHTQAYSNKIIQVEHPFFDYILLLVPLLIIALFTYIQIYFDWVEILLNWTSFISALILIYMAYRFDSRALLAIGIVAFAATIGITVSPINWTKGLWLSTTDLYLISIIFGGALVAIGQISVLENIKKHFKFTYVNLGILIYFMGCISAIFDSNYSILAALFTLGSGIALAWFTWKEKDFLFFLYSNIASYIAFTYLIIELIKNSSLSFNFLIYYFPISSIGYISFLIIKKSHFSHDQ